MIQDLLSRARSARAGARGGAVARRKSHGWRLRAWRALWEHAVNHGWPLPALLWVEGYFLDAGMKEALGQAAREYRAATADTIPAAPAGSWDCLVGGPELDEDAGAEHAARVDLHGDDVWPSSRARKEWVA